MNLHNVNYNSLSHRVNRLSRQGQGAIYKLKEYLIINMTGTVVTRCLRPSGVNVHSHLINVEM